MVLIIDFTYEERSTLIAALLNYKNAVQDALEEGEMLDKNYFLHFNNRLMITKDLIEKIDPERNFIW